MKNGLKYLVIAFVVAFLATPVFATTGAEGDDSVVIDADQWSFEETTLDMVVTQSNTIQNDLIIRLTDDGIAYLARILRVSLIGLVEENDYTNNTAGNAMVTILNDALIGLNYVPVAFTVLGSDVGACLNFSPHNTLTNYNQYCSCNGSEYAGTWYGQSIRSCENCFANTASNSKYSASTLIAYNRRGDFYDPYDTTGTPQLKNFFWGPYYKSAITYHTWSSSYGNNSVFTGTACNMSSGGSLTNGSICDPKSPRLGIYMTNDTTGANALQIKLALFNVQIHGQVAIDVIDTGGILGWILGAVLSLCEGWIRGSGSKLAGLASSNDFLFARLYAKFTDGYFSMMGRNGVDSSGGGTGNELKHCNTASVSDGEDLCAINNDCPVGHSCNSIFNGGGWAFECYVPWSATSSNNPYKAISNSPILSIEATMDRVGDSDCVSSSGGSSGVASAWGQSAGSGDSFCFNQGIEFNFSCSSGQACNFCNTAVDILEGIISRNVVKALRNALSGILGDVLQGSLGLPLDFNELFAGNLATANDICGYRDTIAGGPGCSHGAISPFTDDFWSGRTGTCACDDINAASNTNGAGDRQLNYQDTNDAYVNPGGYTGCSGSPSYGEFRGSDADSNCFSDLDTYGVGRGMGGWDDIFGGTSEKPPYDIGAYMSAGWDTSGNKGINIIGDLAMVPHADLVNDPGTYTCFGADGEVPIYLDATGPDNSINSRPTDNSTYDTTGYYDTYNGTNHITISASQYNLEQFFYAMLTSGMFCIVFGEDGGDATGINQMLKAKNMQKIIPALSAAIENNNVDPEDTVTVLFRPAGVPTVRTMGGLSSTKLNGNFPNGHCIPNDGSNTHDPSNLKLLDVGPSCSHTEAYDLMVALPNFWVEFWVVDEGNGGAKTMLFRTSIDVVLAAALAYTKSGPAVSIYSQSYSKYLEVLADVWLGCQGTTIIGTQTGLNDLDEDCLTVGANTSVDGIDERGISAIITTLLSTRISLLVRTSFQLDGLTMDFNYLGAQRYQGSSYDDDDSYDNSWQKSYQRFGDGAGDSLVIAAALAGNLDLGRIFGLVAGAAAPAAYLMEPDTFIVAGDPDSDAATIGDPTALPGTQFSLTPFESASVGMRTDGARFAFYSAPSVARLAPDADDTMLYSYRIDGGPWTPFRAQNEVAFNYLPNGVHVLEVRSKDGYEFYDSTPARIEFFVDDIAPSAFLTFEGNRHTVGMGTLDIGSQRSFDLELFDNISDAKNMRASWSVDGSRWHPLYASTTQLTLPSSDNDLQVLQVRLTDEAGNATTNKFAIQTGVDDSGWGCTTTTGAPYELLLLLVPFVALRRRRQELPI